MGAGCADRSCSGGGRSCGGPFGRTLWSHAEKPATPSAILPGTAATASAVATALSTALPIFSGTAATASAVDLTVSGMDATASAVDLTVDETLSAVLATFSGMDATASAVASTVETVFSKLPGRARRARRLGRGLDGRGGGVERLLGLVGRLGDGGGGALQRRKGRGRLGHGLRCRSERVGGGVEDANAASTRALEASFAASKSNGACLALGAAGGAATFGGALAAPS